MRKIEYLMQETGLSPEKIGEVLSQVFMSGYEQGMIDEENDFVAKSTEAEFIGRVIGHWTTFLAKEHDQNG